MARLAPTHGRLPRSALAWALYEGVRTPYVILIKIYIFVPYVAATLVGDPVAGQALLAKLGMAYGLVAAFTAPLLGAAMDQRGPRKGVLGGVTALLIACCFSFWWATPSGLGVALTCAALFVAGLAFAYSEVLHNSLLPFAAPPAQISAASGLGLSLGSFVSVLLLALVLWGLALPAKMSAAWLPDAPLLGLSASANEPSRIVGPIVAIVLLFGSVPFFLMGRDATKVPHGRSGSGFAQLRATLRELPANRPMAWFLGSRMIYTDGLTAILLYTGIYAAGVMRWSSLELTALAILVSCFLSLGGLLGAWLDRRFGPQRAIRIELAMVIGGQIALLSMTRDQAPFLPSAIAPIWQGPMFTTLPELAFVAVACFNALGTCACYASSRSMLTRLAPPETAGSWFGLYALSGSVTIWLGSALVGLATSVWGSQQAGFGALILLLILGWCGMRFVNADRPAR